MKEIDLDKLRKDDHDTRKAWEMESRLVLARELGVKNIDRIVVDIAPLSHILREAYGLYDTRVYYRVLNKPKSAPMNYISERGVASLWDIKREGSLREIKNEANVAFANIPEGSVYTLSRNLDELVAMETFGASVLDVRKAIANMHNHPGLDGIVKGKRSSTYSDLKKEIDQMYDRSKSNNGNIEEYTAKDIKIFDEDLPLPHQITEKGIFKIKYGILLSKDKIYEGEIPISNLGINRRGLK